MKMEQRLSKPFAFTEGDTNIVPVMDIRVLYEGFIDVIDHIYTPAGSYQRLMKFFDTYRFPKGGFKVKERLTLYKVRIALSVMFRLGIADSNWRYFWKLILWSVLHNRKMLDKAFFYSVMIYQMHETYKTILQKANTEMDSFGKQAEALENRQPTISFSLLEH